MNRQPLLRVLILFAVLLLAPIVLVRTGTLPQLGDHMVPVLSVITLVGTLAVAALVLRGRGERR